MCTLTRCQRSLRTLKGEFLTECGGLFSYGIANNLTDIHADNSVELGEVYLYIRCEGDGDGL